MSKSPHKYAIILFVFANDSGAAHPSVDSGDCVTFAFRNICAEAVECLTSCFKLSDYSTHWPFYKTLSDLNILVLDFQMRCSNPEEYLARTESKQNCFSVCWNVFKAITPSSIDIFLCIS